MSDPNQKTFIASILFLDIIAYSERSVVQQMNWKAQFNSVLSHSIAHIDEAGRILLDTGDGAALCFLDNPEDALDVAIACLQKFQSIDDERQIDFKIRSGINLGPIKIVRDINDHRNLIGDGINVAQRVMSFAGSNQIFVSRSFYDVAAYLTRRDTEIFRYQGIYKDKHAREHEVYQVVIPGVTTEAAPTPSPPGLNLGPTPVAPALEPGLGNLDPESFKALEKSYAQYVGPIAGTLLKRAWKNASSIDDLCARLCDAIPGQDDKDAFQTLFRRRPLTPDEPHAADGHGLKPLVEPLATSSHPPADVTSFELDSALLARAERELAHSLGPIAKVLVARQAKTAKSVEAFCQGLADQIQNIQEKEHFLETVKRI